MSTAVLPEALLSRVEDAGINATGVPQTLWVDGWLLRYGPGKARRSRCINALAPGRQPLDERLAQADAVYRAAELPLYFRITPFTAPAAAGGPALESALAGQGFHAVDFSRVMVLPDLAVTQSKWPQRTLPAGMEWSALNGAQYAAAVGALRGSPERDIEGHAARLATSPVPYRGLSIRRRDDGAVMACAQTAAEAGCVGLYDVFTHPDARGQGLSQTLCERMLSDAVAAGTAVGNLQVDAANAVAMRLYARIGFQDAFGYHYLERA